MTDDDWLTLEPDERIEWEASPRLMRAAPGIAGSLVLVALTVGGAALVDPLVLVGLVVAPIPGAVAYLRVVNTRFIVTNRACHRKSGVLGISVRTVELDRIQNTRSSQGVLGTVFGYGTVEIEVAGGRDLRYFDVYDPDDLRRLVERFAGGHDRELPGTPEQWRAVRDELREIRRAL